MLIGARPGGTSSAIIPARAQHAAADGSATRSAYINASTITGELQDGGVLRFRRVLSRRQRFTLVGFIAVNGAAGLALVLWLILASSISPAAFTLGIALLVMMVCLEGTRLWQAATLVIFACRARDPIPLKPRAAFRMAVLTTIVPGKEPLAMVAGTLQAMKDIRGDKDVWLLDEGNSPDVRAACAQLGVNHFSRKGVQRWNESTGAFRAKTKAGNHNAWRDAHGADYDLVAQMDPDHVPSPDFLERTIGYFNDPDTAFVVAPMVYGNSENWIAHGAAQQAYVFQGVVQRGANGMDAPLLIGTNHVYRVRCWDQIDGYQDSIIEDHLTAMRVYTAHNQDTGNRWRGVYTPDVIAVGEGPTSFTDFFNQQKRWAWGCWQVILQHSPRMLRRMSWSQRLSFLLLQPYYPSVAVSWILSILLTSGYMISRASLHLPLERWALLWGASIGSNFLTSLWLRRFNLTHHERKEWGFVGLMLQLMAAPVFVAAAASKLAGRKLAYAVTAKGDLASPDNIRTFMPHLLWLAWGCVMLGLSLAGVGSSWPGLRFWATMTVTICVSPIFAHYVAGSRAWAGALRATARIRPSHSTRNVPWPALAGLAEDAGE
jgi:cellulose synthase (UDP-forming)